MKILDRVSSSLHAQSPNITALHEPDIRYIRILSDGSKYLSEPINLSIFSVSCLISDGFK